MAVCSGYHTDVVKRAAALLAALLFCSAPLPADPIPLELGTSDAPAVKPHGLLLRVPVIPDHVTGVQRSFNESLGQTVAPSENAVVSLLYVFGDEVFDEGLKLDSLSMLGVRRTSEIGPRFEYAAAYVQKHLADFGMDPDAATEQLETLLRLSIEKPWTREESPLLADFLEANRPALDLVVIASEKPHYYAPLLSQESPQRLLSASFAIERRLPYMALCLTSRAFHRLGQNDFPGALNDLLACHRLALLLAEGSPLDVSVAKAHTIDAIPYRAELTLLEQGVLTADQAREMLRALRSLPQISPAAVAADRGERAIVHQEIELLRTDDESIHGFFEGPEVDVEKLTEQFKTAGIDWNLVRARADEIQDEVVRLLRIADLEEQRKEIEKFVERGTAWDRAEEETEQAVFEERFRKDPAAASRWIGECLAMSLRTNCWQRQSTDNRATMRRGIVEIGLALAAFRQQHGAYPESLSELVPEFLEKVPDDAHANGPFTYRPHQGEKALLISWGANRQDDAGLRYNDDTILELP